MNDVLKRVANFFKSRRTEATVGPKIDVDYDIWTYCEDIKLALKKQWEELRKELDLHPECIEKQDWKRYREGERQESILINIEGVIITLDGPYYPDPDYKAPKPEPPKTDEERANEGVDQLLHSTNLVWVMTHCSRAKFETFIDFLRSGRMTRKRD